MWESRGAIKRAKDEGYIHVLIHDAPQTLKANFRRTILNDTTVPSELVPLEIRDAAYTKLLELSPAWKFERELITGERGLLSRGFKAEDVSRFGAFPARAVERDALAQVINEALTDDLPAYAAQRRGAAVLGIPGFWEGRAGSPRLGRATDYKRPALVIPYRDRQGNIQACQLRFSGARGKSIYTWLSTSEDRLDKEPRGTSSGCPIHFAVREDSFMPDLPFIITEGALKAEAFVAHRPACRAIATAGVSIAHDALIEATRGEDAVIAFDSDHRTNAQVCRQLAKLIAERERDARLSGQQKNTNVVLWEGAKGIDDAVLANVHLRVVGVKEWSETLQGKPAEEVAGVWRQYNFVPAFGESERSG
ncbi:MAG: DUF3854 domain-containing protein [Acidobacteria bacterium]|nr:DUF3854 domain-containing protein [Acidobacteriota bacterium]MCA1628030.1 DUF3854 domain-containing protein [Acidobacteriota bacterium]